MTVENINDVEFGEELASFTPDTSLENCSKFARAVGWGGPRFESHEGAQKEGFPGALVPGIMGMGFMTSTIHAWAPSATIEKIDTNFRAFINIWIKSRCTCCKFLILLTGSR